MQVRLDELCFVGDRLLTDVVFGNLHGMFTVHTRPLTLKGDNRPAAIFRFLERKVRSEDRIRGSVTIDFFFLELDFFCRPIVYVLHI